MKCLIAVFAGLFLFANAPVFAQTLKNKQVLVFSKTAGYRHASIANGKQMFLQLAATEKFTADTTEDASVFNAKNLEKYDVVIFLSTTGDVLNANEQAAFQEFIRSGKSFLGIHGAADTEYEWPWYNQLAGAYFSDHPEPQKAAYINLDSTHPATSFWPVIFNRFEEIYNFKSVQKSSLTFLLAVDETSYTGGKMPDFHPAAWYHEFEGGKAFYTALGHHPETYTDADFRKHITGALRWLVAQ
jgi:type 1 glutamine amidotransferase